MWSFLLFVFTTKPFDILLHKPGNHKQGSYWVSPKGESTDLPKLLKSSLGAAECRQYSSEAM
jgi:hypothetical protein